MKHDLIPFLIIGLMILTGCQKTVAETTGLKDGKLRPCADKRSCVCTQDPAEQHRIEPIRYDATQEEARDKLLGVIRHMERSTLVQVDPDYIHAEFRSAVFSFVDDVEFLFDDAAKLIHFRSAARMGSYDFNVNRKRMEEIRKRFMGPG
jgi:uncharacterized protein (DUF1499 family)